MRGERAKGLLSAWGAVAVYSTAPVLVQASGLSGANFSFWRLLVGAPLVTLLAILRPAGPRRLSRRSTRLAALAGVWLAANQLTMMSAIKASTVADVTLISTLSPVIVGALGVVVLQERLSARFWTGGVIAMTGAMIVAVFGAGRPEVAPLGIGLAFLAAVTFSVFLIVLALVEGGVDLRSFLAVASWVALVVAGTFIVVTNEALSAPTVGDWAAVLGVAAGAGTIGHLLLQQGVQTVPAALVSIVKLSQPVMAAALAWVTLGERLLWSHGLGGLVLLAGVAMASRAHGSSPSEDESGDERLPPMG